MVILNFSLNLVLKNLLIIILKIFLGIIQYIKFVVIFETVNNMIKIKAFTGQILSRYDNSPQMINL